MKTLKKTLCLVLAVVMVVGVLIIPANAAETTATEDLEAEYAEAIAVVKGLNIMTGDEGGFRGNDTITRQEATKVIASLALTKAIADEQPESGLTFTDCGGAAVWGRQYIAWCENKGIVSGDEKGFRPEDDVTVAEFAKMVLCALGYDADVQGYKGDAWATSVQSDARRADLNADLTLNWSAPIKRAEVAQMVFNALSANTVYYRTSGPSISVPGTVEVQPSKELQYNGFTLGEDVHDMDNIAVDTNKPTGKITPVIGLVTKNSANDPTSKTDGTTTIKAASVAEKPYKVNTGVDECGQIVKVYTAGDTVIALIPVSTEITTAAISSKADDFKAKFGSVTEIDETYDSTLKSGSLSTFDATGGTAPAGTYVIYGGKVVNFKAPVVYKLSYISAMDSDGKITLATASNGGTPKELGKNEYNGYEGLAKDQLVIYSTLGGIYNITKAEPVKARPSAINTTSSTVSFGGVDYTKNGNDFTTATQLKNKTDAASMDFAKEYSFYLDGQGGYFTATGEAAPTPDEGEYVFAVYAYSTVVAGDQWGEGGGTYYWIQGVGTDGLTHVYQLKKDDYDTVSAKITSKGAIYKVTVATEAAEDNQNENLKAVYATFTGTDSTTYGVETVTDGLEATAPKLKDKYYFTSDVKFIYVTGSKDDVTVDVKNGVQALDENTEASYVAKKVGETDNYEISVVFIGKAFSVPATPSTDVVYSTEAATSTVKAPYTDENGEIQSGYLHTVYINGVKTEVVTKDATAITAGFHTYTKTEGGLYTFEDSKATNLVSATPITNMYGGLLSVDGHEDLSVVGATVYNVSTNTKVPNDPTALTTDDTVALVLNADGTAVVTIYVTASTRS